MNHAIQTLTNSLNDNEMTLISHLHWDASNCAARIMSVFWSTLPSSMLACTWVDILYIYIRLSAVGWLLLNGTETLSSRTNLTKCVRVMQFSLNCKTGNSLYGDARLKFETSKAVWLLSEKYISHFVWYNCPVYFCLPVILLPLECIRPN
jgi:hypothetical protein